MKRAPKVLLRSMRLAMAAMASERDAGRAQSGHDTASVPGPRFTDRYLLGGQLPELCGVQPGQLSPERMYHYGTIPIYGLHRPHSPYVQHNRGHGWLRARISDSPEERMFQRQWRDVRHLHDRDLISFRTGDSNKFITHARVKFADLLGTVQLRLRREGRVAVAALERENRRSGGLHSVNVLLVSLCDSLYVDDHQLIALSLPVEGFKRHVFEGYEIRAVIRSLYHKWIDPEVLVLGSESDMHAGIAVTRRLQDTGEVLSRLPRLPPDVSDPPIWRHQAIPQGGQRQRNGRDQTTNPNILLYVRNLTLDYGQDIFRHLPLRATSPSVAWKNVLRRRFSSLRSLTLCYLTMSDSLSYLTMILTGIYPKLESLSFHHVQVLHSSDFYGVQLSVETNWEPDVWVARGGAALRSGRSDSKVRVGVSRRELPDISGLELGGYAEMRSIVSSNKSTRGRPSYYLSYSGFVYTCAS
ncbi:hypothetical protein NUW54_g6460 [Trametes sanguinea]|uniref:Uncharacterized protein n=1 Tax=Trametes sanguinea TaxID=158606 RepID=A0ACC1PUX6_9APHY|nr:hypothetical protein NUW54_g6460 [Trametes sanguinea]